ncbi:MAG TPA: MATE family efflux transporter, partial [Pyrodictium sp.]|nr:MATE family efflux transporter [Pyrodictium sp.]
PMVRATGIVVAQSLGAGMIRRSRSTVLTGGLIISGATLVYVALLLFLRDWFISLFTTDPQVVAAARNMLTIFAPSIIGFNMFMLANVVARSSGHTVFLSLLGIARLWLLRIPLSWLLAYRLGFGNRGLWTGMALSNYVIGVLAVAWLARRDWARAVIEEAKTVATPGIGGK